MTTSRDDKEEQAREAKERYLNVMEELFGVNIKALAREGKFAEVEQKFLDLGNLIERHSIDN